MSQALSWFQYLCHSSSLCCTLDNFFQSRFQFSSCPLNCVHAVFSTTCLLSFWCQWSPFSFLDIVWFFSYIHGQHMVVSLFLSLGFCSSNTLSLHSGYQTHVVKCSPRRLFFFAFIPFHLGLNPREAASPSSLCGPGFFCFAFQGFHIYRRFSEQIFFFIMLVSGWSPSLGHWRPTDDPNVSVSSYTHWLRGFSSSLTWKAFLSFLTVQAYIWKHAFSVLVFKKWEEKMINIV